MSVFYYLFGLEPTSGSPERRKPFWGEEEQWNKRRITFALRINKSGLERYGTCDDAEAPNLASTADFAFENLHKTRLSFGENRAMQGRQNHKLSDDLHSRPEQNVGQSAPATANAYTNPTVDFGKM